MPLVRIPIGPSCISGEVFRIPASAASTGVASWELIRADLSITFNEQPLSAPDHSYDREDDRHDNYCQHDTDPHTSFENHLNRTAAFGCDESADQNGEQRRA